MTAIDLELHEKSLRLYKGIVHAMEAYAMRPGHESFLPIAGSLRNAADDWSAWVRRTREARGPVLPPRRPIP